MFFLSLRFVCSCPALSRCCHAASPPCKMRPSRCLSAEFDSSIEAVTDVRPFASSSCECCQAQRSRCEPPMAHICVDGGGRIQTRLQKAERDHDCALAQGQAGIRPLLMIPVRMIVMWCQHMQRSAS